LSTFECTIRENEQFFWEGPRLLAHPLEYYYTNDGVLIPLGHGVPSNARQTSLLYNEYIVYNTDQINMRYPLRVDFQYKY